MVAQDHWSKLKRLAGILTGPTPSHGDVFAASEDLFELFLQLSGMDAEAASNRNSLLLPPGKALAPTWAAHCIKDYWRTHIFLRGLLQAIEKARQLFPNTPIHVLYAGCGPFASLAVPLLPLLSGQPVIFTLLEICPASLGYLEKIISILSISPWIREIVLADATTYHVDAATPVHILVGEMMQAGLQNEPQVAMLSNLAPQVTAGGFIVPECITVQAGLLHTKRNQARMLGIEEPSGEVYNLFPPVFELSQASVAAANRIEQEIFPEIEIDIPVDHDLGFNQLALFTRIQVFGTERLDVWESGLTQPLLLMKVKPEQRVRKIGLRYEVGSVPGFRWRVL